jgi:ribosomal protein S18 acetylase RimI-like enzyme
MRNSYIINEDFHSDPIYIIGYFKDNYQAGLFYIAVLYIFPKYRGIGLASLLLEKFFLESARSRRNMVLQVDIDNKKKLLGFYKNNGFKSYALFKKESGITLQTLYYCHDKLRVSKLKNNRHTFEITGYKDLEEPTDHLYQLDLC